MAVEHPQAGGRLPAQLDELLAWSPDDAACLRYLERLRWGDGFVCRFCGELGGSYWQMRDGLRRCSSCRSETSVTAGTIFAGTRRPLVSWSAAVWYVVNQKQGVSALGLQRVLGSVATRRRGRGCTSCGARSCSPVASCSREWSRSMRLCRRASSRCRRPAVGWQGDRRDRRRGRYRATAGTDQRISDVTRDTLSGFVLDNVARGTEVRTDAWTGYDDIGRFRFDHVVTNVSASGDPAHVALPHVHILRLATEALDPRHAPGLDRPPPARLLPGRVHLPLQPPPGPPRGLLSTAYWRAHSRPIHAPTRSSSTDSPHSQAPPGIGGASWIT